jgi:carbonic anhydrase
MQKLIAGLAMFQARHFHAQRPLFERLARGQSPEALFITCADSRIDPCLLTQTNPGELFILRNAGNLVPPYGSDEGAAAATIEYAVQALGVHDIIVCGHSHCGAMAALMEPSKLADLPAMSRWLGHADHSLAERLAHLGPEERIKAATEANVVAQLENLRSHPSVLKRLQRGDLRLHGWVYQLERGEVSSYRADEDRFRRLSPDLTAAV